MKVKLDYTYFIMGALLVGLLASIYMYNIKDVEVRVLQKKIESLDPKNDPERKLLEEQLDILLSSCLYEVGCRSQYNYNVRQVFLRDMGFNGSKELNKETHLVEDGMPQFKQNMTSFVAENCKPLEPGPLGTFYSVYYYSYQNKTIGILMDDDIVSLHCAWIADSPGSYRILAN